MQPFWDVLWSDTKALALFATPMLVLAVPASALAALFGAVNWGLGSWNGLLRAIGRGVLVGTGSALILSMLIEFSLKAEGLTYGRRALRDVATLRLWLAAPIVAIAGGFLAARYYAPASLSQERRRRYTLRQLFAAQLIAGLLLGWWAYTRRDEIGQRRAELEWQVRDREAKAVYEPYGWTVQTWPGYDEIGLIAPRHIGMRDEPLTLVRVHGPVTSMAIVSDTVSDTGLGHIAGAKRLRRLIIRSPQLTDSGVAQLSELPRLRYLEIASPNLTAESLSSLAKIKSLRYVVLTTTQITAEEQEAFHRTRPDVHLRFSQP
jgi:hypothetical protein